MKPMTYSQFREYLNSLEAKRREHSIQLEVPSSVPIEPTDDEFPTVSIDLSGAQWIDGDDGRRREGSPPPSWTCRNPACHMMRMLIWGEPGACPYCFEPLSPYSEGDAE